MFLVPLVDISTGFARRTMLDAMRLRAFLVFLGNYHSACVIQAAWWLALQKSITDPYATSQHHVTWRHLACASFPSGRRTRLACLAHGQLSPRPTAHFLPSSTFTSTSATNCQHDGYALQLRNLPRTQFANTASQHACQLQENVPLFAPPPEC